MREIHKKPEEGLCLVRWFEPSEYSVTPIIPGTSSASPTSEFQSHFLIHQTLQSHRPEHKAVLHTHPSEIIALTQFDEMNNQKAMNKALYSILPELGVYLPEGIGFIPFLKPGSTELAQASAASMETFRVVIWEKHGIIASGKSLEDAFDAIDIVAKAAKIWLMVQSFRAEHLDKSKHSS